jgi:hypothetical protein
MKIIGELAEWQHLKARNNQVGMENQMRFSTNLLWIG